MQPKTEGSLYSQCVAQCNLGLLSCLGPATSGGRIGQPTNPPNAPPPNAPPKGISGSAPSEPWASISHLSGAEEPYPQKGQSACLPLVPLIRLNQWRSNQPGTGSAGPGSGETIYAKGGTVKPPVITTSPIGVTTTTVYDKNGNSTSTNTGPTGKILSKTTTMLGQAGVTRSTDHQCRAERS